MDPRICGGVAAGLSYADAGPGWRGSRRPPTTVGWPGARRRERAAFIGLQLQDLETAQHPLVEARSRCRGSLEPSGDGVAGTTRDAGGRRDAHALDAQARDLVELPSTAAKTGVHCPRVRAERLPAHRAAVPPPSARLRGKRAVAHDVEARVSEIVAPELGARHLVDRVHRASVPGRETRGFAHDLGGEGDRSTATGASTDNRRGSRWRPVELARVGNGGTTVSVVVPVYNSARMLPDLVAELEPVLSRVATAYELILVNDGSPDASGRVAADLARQYGWVRAIDLSRNYGQHSALLCGIRAAIHPIVITMDDDCQHPPEEIGPLIEKLDEGFDVVYGWPRREQHGLWRAVASRVTKVALEHVLGADTARRVSGFRALRTGLRDAFAGYRGPFVNLDVLLTWGTDRFTSIDVHHRLRHSGTSNYTARKLIQHALNMLTGFTTVPLQLAVTLGFALSVFGLVLLGYVLGRYLVQGVAVPGFTFLASVIVIFSGAQLFTLGVVGEYLARMHYRMMAKPAYVVQGDSRESSVREVTASASEAVEP